MVMINYAADYGWGPYTLLWIFLIVVIVTTVGFLIVTATGRRKQEQQTFASKRKYHPEMYWAIGIAGVLVWLWVNSYPWMPPIASSAAANTPTDQLQVVNITAGQWFWIMNKGDEASGSGDSSHVTLVADEPVKFVAHSVDVNHGFGVFRGNDGSAILLQMQVIPKMDNIFYYNFKEPGMYTVRCLEYCGYAHPYMTSVIEVVPSSSQTTADLTAKQPLPNSTETGGSR